MRYFFDLEFYELQLISIGMISEDGRELYFESCEVDWLRVESWILRNVKPHLTGDTVTESEIREALRAFVGDDPEPEFWAYTGAHDWVIMTQLFGRLLDKPNNWPMRHKELQELRQQVGKPPLPKKSGNAHLAIDDARWNMQVYDFLTNILERLVIHSGFLED